jgi:RNA polymerase sigma-70 factor (ECF subfamily)
MDEKENRLVEMVLDGHPEAFEALVTPYRRSLLGLAYRLTANEEDAKEAAQEALLRAYRYLRSFDPGQSFRNWLLRILVNAAHKANRPGRLAVGLEDAPAPVETSPGPPARYQAKEFRARLTDCLGVLGKREREVFLLRDIEDRSIKETAEILHSSSVSVRVNLSSARRKIKNEMTRRYPGILGERR